MAELDVIGYQITGAHLYNRSQWKSKRSNRNTTDLNGSQNVQTENNPVHLVWL